MKLVVGFLGLQPSLLEKETAAGCLPTGNGHLLLSAGYPAADWTVLGCAVRAQEGGQSPSKASNSKALWVLRGVRNLERSLGCGSLEGATLHYESELAITLTPIPSYNCLMPYVYCIQLFLHLTNIY
jgi:hypothetical protein